MQVCGFISAVTLSVTSKHCETSNTAKQNFSFSYYSEFADHGGKIFDIVRIHGIDQNFLHTRMEFRNYVECGLKHFEPLEPISYFYSNVRRFASSACVVDLGFCAMEDRGMRSQRGLANMLVDFDLIRKSRSQKKAPRRPFKNPFAAFDKLSSTGTL